MIVPEDQDPLLNTVLGGARIQRRVSAGLLANVYLGHYERLNVPVAVKVLSPKATSQGMNKERFVREGRALAQLSHPNIIKIYNVGQDNGRYFIVMDWIQDGMNLRQLAQSRPLTPVQSLKVARRLAEALDYIHQKQLIHRDIKPANVCLRKGGVPVLMDFSLIKDQQSDVQLTAPGTIMGTVNFMPPEQAQPGGPFGNVGPWSDVYSVTGTLYWLLTGRPPFKGRTPMETIIKLIREPHVAPSQVNPTVPAEVDELVARGLAKKAEERFQSSREFMAAVDQVLQTCAEALARGTPPPLAEDEAAPGAPAPAAPAPAPPPQGSAMMPKGWGQQQVAQAPPAPPPAPAAPLHPAAAAPTGSVAGRNWGAGQQAPAPAPVRTAASGVQPAVAASPTGSGMSKPADAVRQTARLRGSSAEGRMPMPAPVAQQPPAEAAGQQWVPTNGLDVAPDNEPTLRLKNNAAGGLAPTRPGSGPLTAATQSPPMPPRNAGLAPSAPASPPPATGKPGDLKRSWVEDIPAAPSWTEQQKDPGASVLGMRAAQNVDQASASADIPSSGEAPAAPPRPETPRSAPRPVSERINKAPALPPRKGRRSTLELVLIVLSVLIFLACVGVGSYLYFSRQTGGS